MSERKISACEQHEIWRPVVGYEQWYEVSNHGRVKRVKYHSSTYIGKILKPQKGIGGYLRVKLCADGHQQKHSVHRLVAAAFIGPCPDGMEMNHCDCDKTNNTICNIEYVTKSENTLHAYRNGLMSQRGEKNAFSKLTREDVFAIRDLIGSKTNLEIAKKFGVTNCNISAIAHGKSWAWLKERAA